MARPSAAPAKEPGRIKQFLQVLRITRESDPNVVWWMLLGFVVGVALGVVLAVVLGGGNVFSIIVWVLVGVMAGGLAALIILNRRAERTAYAQIEGRPGAVGAVLRTALRRGWRGSEVPVAVNGRTKDAVYRAVGRPGVVLLIEGPKARTQRLVDEERRKVARVAPNVPVSVLHVGTEEGAIRLSQINRRLARLKPRLTRAEVLAVSNRLESLTAGLPVPKGVDPTRLRPVRR
ncbi:DUF4191 domain-containing protein [Amnibacterium sp. CER49]|uniref:DUF4191 domain-containing protein n=1 Tax=Amnibacterium sp. CER49 TaxID=3039161 RepID=UPI0024474059|nr:DUF4191 domain-containing protein [Amnibacterium sp. CER49]MDH2442341.1 DUF4191 domain-containing protein [Amnibacterium sp. CER49]